MSSCALCFSKDLVTQGNLIYNMSADNMPLWLIQKCSNMVEHRCFNSPAQSRYTSRKQEFNKLIWIRPGIKKNNFLCWCLGLANVSQQPRISSHSWLLLRWTPLHVASWYGHLHLVRVLCQVRFQHLDDETRKNPRVPIYYSAFGTFNIM